MWMKEEGKGNIRTGTIDALGKNYYYILAGLFLVSWKIKTNKN